jgi:hypothetical protein
MSATAAPGRFEHGLEGRLRFGERLAGAGDEVRA